jgi:molybdenum cofactor sulfurtransferase
MESLRSHVFGNPHSTNPASQAMSNLVEHGRTHVLDYFNASPDDYVAIFTANTTDALKLVEESWIAPPSSPPIA